MSLLIQLRDVAADRHSISPRHILSLLPGLVAYFGPDLRYLYANDAYSRWRDISPDAIAGLYVRDVVGERNYLLIANNLRRALAGEHVTYEYHIFDGDHQRRVQGSYVPDVNTRGEVVGVVTLVTDISRRDDLQLHVVAATISAALLSPSAALAGSLAESTAVAERDRISVVVEGSGPDVILIPGLASSREVWRGLADRLKRTHRLHLVQLAGFAGQPAVAGGTEQVAGPAADAVADYIARQGLRAPAIIGHSLGGEVALMLGARHPERVGRMMVVDALPFYSLLFDRNATAASVRARAAGFRDTMLAAPSEQANAMQATSIARLIKTPAARPALVDAASRSDRKTVADATYERMTTDLRPELARIKAPVEVVYAYDPIYGVPAASIDGSFAQAYATLPGVRLKRIDESFHFVMLDQPERFGEAVAAFLAN